MSRSFTILVRKFGPFEQAVRIFWDQLKEARGLDVDLELVPLDLPELHAAILTRRFDVAHVNTDWLAECWARGCLEDSRDGSVPTHRRTTRKTGRGPSWGCRPSRTASPGSPSTTAPSA